LCGIIDIHDKSIFVDLVIVNFLICFMKDFINCKKGKGNLKQMPLLRPPLEKLRSDYGEAYSRGQKTTGRSWAVGRRSLTATAY
jgi:hypothetical protein